MYNYMRRDIPWYPRFKWVNTIGEAADLINLPHEDYPHRIEDTSKSITRLIDSCDGAFPIILTHDELQGIHLDIFYDEDFAGRYRDVNVIVGSHRPPNYEQIPKLMDELIYSSQHIAGLQELYKFYHDFETIHPFQDGNGRVGGVVVAYLSNLITRNGRFMAPCQ